MFLAPHMALYIRTNFGNYSASLADFKEESGG